MILSIQVQKSTPETLSENFDRWMAGLAKPGGENIVKLLFYKML